jgi:hypothetical protein
MQDFAAQARWPAPSFRASPRTAASRLREDPLDFEPRDAFVMPDVARDERQVVAKRGRCDLKIGGARRLPRALKVCADLPKDPSDPNVVGQHRDLGQEHIVNAPQSRSRFVDRKAPWYSSPMLTALVNCSSRGIRRSQVI